MGCYEKLSVWGVDHGTLCLLTMTVIWALCQETFYSIRHSILE